jgi:hypothetical protein
LSDPFIDPASACGMFEIVRRFNNSMGEDSNVVVVSN